MTGRMGRAGTWGPSGTRERTSASLWAKPHRWNRLAAEGLLPDGTVNPDGHRPRVFCASLADVFEPRPELEQWRRDLFDLIAATPNLDWLVLTKRPDVACEWLRQYAYASGGRTFGWYFREPLDWPVLPNLWIGTSIESTAYTWRADWLRRIPAAVRFISAEPLLASLFTLPGEVTGENRTRPDAAGDTEGVHSPGASGPGSIPGLSMSTSGSGATRNPGRCAADGTDGRALPSEDHARAATEKLPATPARQEGLAGGDGSARAGVQSGAGERAQPAPLDLTGIDWIIVGGESGGRNSRPMHPDWAREIRDHVLAEPCGRCAAGVATDVLHTACPALHVKQWGSHDADGVYRGPAPTSGGKLLDGVAWCEFPDSAPVPA